MHSREGAQGTLAVRFAGEQTVESIEAVAAECDFSSHSTNQFIGRSRVQPAEAQEAPLCVAAVLYGSWMLLMAV